MPIANEGQILKWRVSCKDRETVVVEAPTPLNAKIAAAKLYGEPWTSIVRDMTAEYIGVKMPKKPKKKETRFYNSVKTAK